MFEFRIRHIASIFLLFLSSANAAAQTTALSFKHISYEQGLAQSPIFCMVQDYLGFVWIATSDGLLRYDGYEFKSYQRNDADSVSISSNRIQVILQDSKKRLWIGTANGGLNLFDRKNESFRRIKLNDNTGTDYITSITEDSRGQIWVSTLKGLKIVDAKSAKLRSIPQLLPSAGIYEGKTWSAYQDRDNSVWIGLNTGLGRIDILKKKVLPLPEALKTDQTLMKSKILIIRSDKRGNLWFGTEKSGIFRYDRSKNTCTNYRHSGSGVSGLRSDGIKDIFIHEDETVWIATREGLSIFNPYTEKFANYVHDKSDPNSLSYNLIWNFMRDKAGNIWIGTFAGGIDIYYPGNSNFTNIGERMGSERLGLNNPVVTSMLEEEDGGLWVGTNGGGLNYLDRKAGISRYYEVRDNRLKKSNNIVRALAKDNRGNLWVGTFDGLYRFDKSSVRFDYIKLADAKDSRVISLLEDPDGVWVATVTGGIQFLGYNGETKIYQADPGRKEALKDNNITVLRRDAQNNILVGTENGLNYLDTKTNSFTGYRNSKSAGSLSNNSILSVFQDSKQRIWIGTEGGLNYFDTAKKRFHRFKLDAGVSNDVVLAIIEDKRGHLWLNTNKGIVELIIKTPGSPSNKSIVQTVNYTVTSGLSSTHFLGAAIRSMEGELLFGGMSGITRFFPDKIVKNDYKPNVVLTEFMIENRPVRFGVEGSPLKQSITGTTGITLKHNQNYISFRYAGLNFINPENNQYAYKFKGISGHQDWSYVGNQRVASFTNLEPGEYIFMVKASNNDGVWNNRPTEIKITVLPPLWKTWWAYLIYFLLSASILFVILRFLRNRALLKRDLYLEHVQNERQQELYQMKLNFFTNISHEIRTPLTLIIGPLERLLQDGRHEGIHKQLNVVKNNADRLMKLITELLDFRKAEEGHMKIRCSPQNLVPFCQRIFDSFLDLAQEKNIRYLFHAEVHELELYFDEAQMEKVIMNLLSNAFKFSNDNGEISLSISTRPNQTEWVDIRVTDNGKGIPEDFHEKLFESFFQVDDRGRQNIGSGIGLALSKSIIEKHKGTISVQSHENGAGLTIFTISLRRGRLHLEDSEILTNTPAIMKATPQLPDKTVKANLPEQPVSEAATKPYTILLAEDNEEVRDLIADCLKDDYNIVEFSNGADALKYMEQEIPDLIVSDIMMPEMDGLQLCRAVKSADSTSHIPVVLLTARASVNHQVDGLNIGANAYIPKPFNPQILALNIRNLLAAQEVMRQKFSQQLILETSVIEVESPEHKFLNKLMEAIEANMDDSDFGVDKLVTEMNMSRTVLYKKVQSLTGFSIADLVKNMRLKKAATLFTQTSLNVSEVAYQVGFNDRKHFSREFRKFHQLSPSEYIKKVKEEPVNSPNL